VSNRPPRTSLRLFLFWAAFIALDTATQIAFKVASESVEGMSFGLGFLKVALTTPALWVTVLCYIATFIVWMAVLMRMDLNRAFPLTALGYVTVPVLAFIFFGEQLPLERIAGIGLIIAGVVMIGSEG
jgi:multidrug transporter EmrE-like cation transporter